MQNTSSTPPQLINHGSRPHQVVGNAASGRSSVTYIRDIASTLPAFGLNKYIPEAIKDYAAGGAEARLDELNKERVTFTKFERVPPHGSKGAAQLLLVGYLNGFQVWDVTQNLNCTNDTGVVEELVSVRDGIAVKTMNLLSNPIGPISKDPVAQTLASARPLIALTSAMESVEFPQSVVKLYSVTLQCHAHELRFKSPVHAVRTNTEFIVVAISDAIYAFSNDSMQHIFGLSCYPTPSSMEAPIALGSRWIAYAGNGDEKQDTLLFSDESSNETWSMSSLAKDLTSGFYALGEKGKVKLNQYLNTSNSGMSRHHEYLTAGEAADVASDTASEVSLQSGAPQPKNSKPSSVGMVLIRDCKTRNVVAHFRSHTSPLSLMEFNHSGSLLATSSLEGQTIHIHRILPHREESPGHVAVKQPNQVLLYKLNRGFTPAVVRDISFSMDQNWVGVTSQRGTTHLFPISSQGGPVSVFTHAVVPIDADSSPVSSSWKSLAKSSVANAAVSLKSHLGFNANELRSRARQTGSKELIDEDFAIDDSSDSLAASFLELDKDELRSSLQSTSESGSESSNADQIYQQDVDVSSARTVVPLQAPAYLSAIKDRMVDTETLKALARIRTSMAPSASYPTPRHLAHGSMSSVHSSSSSSPVPSRRLGLSPPSPIHEPVTCGSYDSASSAFLDTTYIDQSSLHAAVLAYWEPVEQLPATVASCFVGNSILTVSCSGKVTRHILTPRRRGDIQGGNEKAKKNPNKLELEVKALQTWDICRRTTWPILAAERSSALFTPRKLQRAVSTEQSSVAEWLSMVELRTHASPEAPLWSMPQFRYCTYDSNSHPSKNPLSTGQVVGTPIEIKGCGPTPTIPQQNKSTDASKRSTSGEVVAAARQSQNGTGLVRSNTQNSQNSVAPKDGMLFDLQTAMTTPGSFMKPKQEPEVCNASLVHKKNQTVSSGECAESPIDPPQESVPVFSWDDDDEFPIDSDDEVEQVSPAVVEPPKQTAAKSTRSAKLNNKSSKKKKR